MAIQTTYREQLAAGKPGQIVNTEAADLVSRTIEDAAGIGFGLAVKQGTEDREVTAFDGSGTVLGITVRERSLDANDPDKFDQYDSARIMLKGVIFVTAAVAVNAGDAVYVTSSNTFTNSASGNTQIDGARFETSTSGADELAAVRLA